MAKAAAGTPSTSACPIKPCSTASVPPVPPTGNASRRRPPAGWRATPGSSPPSTAPTPKSSTSAAAPAPSAPDYATSLPPVTAAAPGPAATGHHPSPKPITGNIGCDGGETNPEDLELLCCHHHHKVHEGGWKMTISNDPDRTPWFWPPDGRPPLQGQRRPLLQTRPHPKTHISPTNPAVSLAARGESLVRPADSWLRSECVVRRMRFAAFPRMATWYCRA